MMIPSRPRPEASLAEVADCMAIVYSHPTWMVKRWLKRFGASATEDLLDSNNRCTLQSYLQSMASQSSHSWQSAYTTEKGVSSLRHHIS